MQPLTPSSNTEARQQQDDDSQSAIEHQYAQAHDPNCPTCHGDGYYYEDVCGDGGSQMFIECECECPDPLIAALEANPTVTAEYMQWTRDEQRSEMEAEQENDNEQG